MEELPKEPTLDKYELIKRKLDKRNMGGGFDEIEIVGLGILKRIYKRCEHCHCRLGKMALIGHQYLREMHLKYWFCPDMSGCEKRRHNYRDKTQRKAEQKIKKVIEHVSLGEGE